MCHIWSWRTLYLEVFVMDEERYQELQEEWNLCALMDEDDYIDWYLDLTDEEQALINLWDKQYVTGVKMLCEAILKQEVPDHA